MANILNWRNQVKFGSGDTIAVHQKVKEGDKSRIQVFEGIVIRIRGHKGLKSFTVRKIGVNGIGVEKIFPENSPTVTKIDVKKKGKVRRAVLSYLRDRVGKRAVRVKDKFVKIESAGEEPELTEEEKAEMKRVVKAARSAVKEGKKLKAEKVKIKEKKKGKKKKKIERKERQFVR